MEPAIEVRQTVQPVGIFAESRVGRRSIEEILANLGELSADYYLLRDLRRNPEIIDNFRSIVVKFEIKDKLAEDCADILQKKFDESKYPSAIVISPIRYVDLVWTCFSPYNVKILIDPESHLVAEEVASFLADSSATKVSDKFAKIVDFGQSIDEKLGSILTRLDDSKRQMMGMDANPAVRDGYLIEGLEFIDSLHDNQRSPELSRTRLTRPPLPDPRLVRRIIRQRDMRKRRFDPDLFADPAWDMLLDLTAARAEHVRVSVTSLCIASRVPPTTALRWINLLIESGLVEKVNDDADRRRSFVVLTDKGSAAMAAYFADIRSLQTH